MKPLSLFLTCLFLSCRLFPQNLLDSVGQSRGFVYALLPDASGQRLFACGLTQEVNAADTVTLGNAYWDGQQWSVPPKKDGSLRLATGVRCLADYQNELYMGGAFMGGVAMDRAHALLRLGQDGWESLPGDDAFWGGAVFALHPEGGRLYVGGAFDSIGGAPAKSLAVYDGNTFQTLPPLGFKPGNCRIYSLCTYNGELYIGGKIYFDAQPYSRAIWRLRNGQWEEPGGGIHGLNTVVGKMFVFKDRLIVGGNLYVAEGDPGNGCAAWDGSQWHPMDFHDGSGNAGAFDFAESWGDLYAIAAYRAHTWQPWRHVLTKWDGGVGEWQEVHCFSDSGGSVLTALVGWNGALYIGGRPYDGGNQQGVFVYHPATGIAPLNARKNWEVYPNPAKESVRLENRNQFAVSNYTLWDMEGRVISQGEVPSPTLEIGTENLPDGTYTLIIRDRHNAAECHNIIVKK